jgi:hypothetical protein
MLTATAIVWGFHRPLDNLSRRNDGGRVMRKLLLAIAVCILTGSAAKANSVTLTVDPSSTLPVSTTATLDINTLITNAGGFTMFSVTEDVSISGLNDINSLFTFPCDSLPCSNDTKITLPNDGTAGMDFILVIAQLNLPASTTVTWTTPEPSTLVLIPLGLGALLLMRKPMVHTRPSTA